MEKGCRLEIAQSFFEHFRQRRWKNNRGQKLKNWKTAAWEWAYKYQ